MRFFALGVSEPGDWPAAKQVVMDFSAGGADTLLSSSGAAIGHFNSISVATLNNQANFLFS